MSFSIFGDVKNGAPFGLSAIQRGIDVLRGSTADNLFDYNQVLRVNPSTLVEEELDLVPYMTDVMRTITQLFAGQYLMAATLMCTVGKIDVRRHLDKLNPNRRPMDNLLRTAGYMAAESANSFYLDKDNYKLGLPTGFTETYVAEDNYFTPAERTTTSSGGARDAVKNIRESTNLGAGIILDLPISDGEHEATVHPEIRLDIKLIDSATMLTVLDPTDRDRMMSVRYNKRKMEKGFMEAVLDVITCKDMIAVERNRIIKDKDNIYAESNARMRRNFMSGVFSGEPSVAACSSIAVITEETATRLELALDKELDDFKARQRIFAAGGYMMLVVIDRNNDRITFYYQNIVKSNTVRPDDIKNAKSGGGNNISEILTAFRNASAPVF